MNLIAWALIGLFSGFIASRIVDRRGFGVVLDTVLGIMGALLGGLVFRALGRHGLTGFNLWSFLVAIIGATLVLMTRNLFSRPRRHA